MKTRARPNILSPVTRHFLALCLACQAAPAQTNQAPADPAARAGDRYLLLFDTSSAMKRRAKAVEQTAHELIASGMYGQLQRGDTLGVWTFNEQLHVGLFPLQVWRPEDKEKIATQVVGFLKSQKYQNKARFDSPDMSGSLEQVVANSHTITVLLFSDGATPLQGTPFDADINSVYAEYRRVMQKSRTPFITVLRAKQGRIFAATANVAPWPVEFPPYPPEPRVTNTIPGKLAASPVATTSPPKTPAPTPPPKTVAPIILDMSKSRRAETSRPPKSETVPAETQTATPIPIGAAKPPIAEAKPVKPPEVAPATLPETGKAAAVPSSTTLGLRPELPAPAGAAKPESPLKPVQTAVTVPPEALLAGRWALLAASVLLTVAAILLVVLLLRQRAGGGASLITRSMEQDKK